jgi:hypothetical protein
MKRASVFSVLTASEHIPLIKMGEEVELFGWIRTVRGSKNVSFVILYDGSTFDSLQVVVSADLGIDLTGFTSGASIKVVGKAVESKGSEQALDFEASSVELIGAAGEEYPIQPNIFSSNWKITLTDYGFFVFKDVSERISKDGNPEVFDWTNYWKIQSYSYTDGFQWEKSISFYVEPFKQLFIDSISFN